MYPGDRLTLRSDVYGAYQKIVITKPCETVKRQTSWEGVVAPKHLSGLIVGLHPEIPHAAFVLFDSGELLWVHVDRHAFISTWTMTTGEIAWSDGHQRI